GEQHMLQPGCLRSNTLGNVRAAMSEQIHPPARHQIKIGAIVRIIKPWSTTMRDRQTRRRSMLLRERMPHQRLVPLGECTVLARVHCFPVHCSCVHSSAPKACLSTAVGAICIKADALMPADNAGICCSTGTLP